MGDLGKDKRLDFLKSCAERMSSFLKARVAKDRLHGLTNVNESVKNGSEVAVDLGLPSLQSETVQLLENQFRPGKCDCASRDHRWAARFGDAVHRGKVAVAEVSITSRPWAIIDYGDTIPGTMECPINDAIGEVITDRNQCRDIHLAAGEVHLLSDDPSP